MNSKQLRARKYGTTQTTYHVQFPASPAKAAILGLFFPGLGQIYNGKVLIGIMLSIVTIFLYFIVIGLFLHLYLAFDAYNEAELYNENLL